MNRTFLALAALAIPMPRAHAQSFNIDYGDPLSAPSPAYAAAGQPGFWNAIRADNSVQYILRDLTGASTSVIFWQFGASGVLSGHDPSVSGEDAQLLNDGVITHDPNLDSCFYFNGLQPGTYELITYAWRPEDPNLMSKSFVDNTPGLEISGGAWPGSHAHGVTYARHIVTVDGSGFMGPHSGLASGADETVGAVCNGMQLRRLGESTAFCFGDGTGAACPCGNNGIAGHGCENASTTGGALLTSSGTASLSSDGLVLSATGERPTAFSIFLQGNTSISPLLYGDGLRCVAGSLKRLFARNAVGGAVSAPQGTDPSISARSAVLGDPIPAGETRNYQVFYRDPTPGFCPNPPGNTWNIGNALSISWLP